MSCLQTIDALMQARKRHMTNLTLLRDHSKKLDEQTTRRGEATMANLMQQVYAIDDQARDSGVQVRDDA